MTDKKENVEKQVSDATDTAKIAVFDHLLIVDTNTGEEIVNKRG